MARSERQAVIHALPESSRGFTLIESIVAMLIITVAAGAVLAAFGGFARGRDLEAAAVRLTADLRQAADEATATDCEVRVYFQSEPPAYSVWHLRPPADTMDTGGDEPAAQAVLARQVRLPGRVRLDSLEVQGPEDEGENTADDSAWREPERGWPEGGQYVAFTGDGNATAAVIALGDDRGGSRRIRIGATARVGEVSPAEDEAPQ